MLKLQQGRIHYQQRVLKLMMRLKSRRTASFWTTIGLIEQHRLNAEQQQHNQFDDPGATRIL
jgi:hypothetical protein